MENLKIFLMSHIYIITYFSLLIFLYKLAWFFGIDIISPALLIMYMIASTGTVLSKRKSFFVLTSFVLLLLWIISAWVGFSGIWKFCSNESAVWAAWYDCDCKGLKTYNLITETHMCLGERKNCIFSPLIKEVRSCDMHLNPNSKN